MNPARPLDARGGDRGGESLSLCSACARVRVIRSERGSVFYLCTLAASDPRFAKYPPQPVRACSGFEPSA